jgi:hypothetical protein
MLLLLLLLLLLLARQCGLQPAMPRRCLHAWVVVAGVGCGEARGVRVHVRD